MKYYIGVMSGTSLDGIDIAIVDFSNPTQIKLISAQTLPFNKHLQHELEELILDQHCDLRFLGEVDIALGQTIAKAINEQLDVNNLAKEDIVAIGSHGQTISHQPNGQFPFSLQIGNPNVIAELTGITTVADFRQRDMAAGGQGAPLVPAFHKALFQSTKQNRVIINIGGMGNITVLPSDSNSKIIGFDTGPGNILLDGWIQRHQHKPYDVSGAWAASGIVNTKLLGILLADDYFSQAIPKSTGREHFNLAWLDSKLVLMKENISSEDVQATLTSLTAHTIATDIKDYATIADAVYVCGGGAHNQYLLKILQEQLAEISVSTTKEIGLDPDWVEACAFAWLACQTLSSKAGNLTAVTGARIPTILGGIYASNEAS
ncbi:MAG: anhydro-N-acetylmuramic acid kinase [Gammaproteobacteria bacterium]|nr:MAG: anhydro-N-acetylmuramic acid kinase [Gammaproteobacteria bacterium]